jgi:hypothetical protein
MKTFDREIWDVVVDELTTDQRLDALCRYMFSDNPNKDELSEHIIDIVHKIDSMTEPHEELNDIIGNTLNDKDFVAYLRSKLGDILASRIFCPTKDYKVSTSRDELIKLIIGHQL